MMLSRGGVVENLPVAPTGLNDKGTRRRRRKLDVRLLDTVWLVKTAQAKLGIVCCASRELAPERIEGSPS